jgi:hypothetical protein
VPYHAVGSSNSLSHIVINCGNDKGVSTASDSSNLGLSHEVEVSGVEEHV